MSQTQTELGNDWYLERVEVTGPEGVCWVFPCEDWFGRTEDDESVGALPFPCMQPCAQDQQPFQSPANQILLQNSTKVLL